MLLEVCFPPCFIISLDSARFSLLLALQTPLRPSLINSPSPFPGLSGTLFHGPSRIGTAHIPQTWNVSFFLPGFPWLYLSVKSNPSQMALAAKPPCIDYCCVTSDNKHSGLKQCTCITSWCLWVRNPGTA